MCEETKKCVLIDPAFEIDRLISFVDEQSAELVGLLVTHGHWDHAGGIPEFLAKRKAPVYGHEAERPRLEKNNIHLDIALKDQQEFMVGTLKIKALHTPGHTEG